MISNIIVLLSLLFAVGFFVVWLLRKEVREQIEQPKYNFQQAVQRFDAQVANVTVNTAIKVEASSVSGQSEDNSSD